MDEINKEIKLTDFFDMVRWKGIQDRLSEVVGANIYLVDLEGKPLTTPRKPVRFCWDILSKSVKGIAHCEDCVSNLIGKLKSEKPSFSCVCHAGLHNFAMPIKLNNNSDLSYLIIGPVLLSKRLEGRECDELANDLKIDSWELKYALCEIKIFSFNGIKSVVELLAEVLNYLVELSYQKSSLTKRREVPQDLNEMIDQIHSSFYFDELLSTLLDVTINATRAQAGSIMLLDRKTNELTIKVSRGLKEEIVKNTRVKVGEGIAGLVAQRRQSLLLDDDIKDTEVKDRFKRPQIRSAIVAPYQIKDRLVGVISVNTYKEEDRFSDDTLRLVGDLAKLASIAAGGISATSSLP